MKWIPITIALMLSEIGMTQQWADTNLIKQHFVSITKDEVHRNHKNVQQLNKIADYIRQEFLKYADTVYYQPYRVNGNVYKNVICSFGTANAKRIVVGAHYDVCEEQEGADDNASGVIGLLELARLLKNQPLNYQIDLVAYTLEEPPYFRSNYMGSYIHAKSLSDQNIDVYGMVCLEMIGYFSDEKKSQEYPLGILSLFYGNKGNYITMVNKSGAGKFAKQFSRKYKKTKEIKTKKFTGPERLQGVDFSDHLNYWKFGYSAMMVTNTAFYRNKNYHETTDTMETLDFYRMSKVINGVFKVLIQMKEN
jgi:hypothetical protein